MTAGHDESLAFKAIGTHWSIESDGTPIDVSLRESILREVGIFEKRFSRFLPDSEVNAFRDASPGSYHISPELHTLLTRADELRSMTEGVYDPVVGILLEEAGYNARYDFTPKESLGTFVLPHWELQGNALWVDGPTAFDLGGIGKGYCIDMIVGMLRDAGHEHVIVEAGGDMYGTTKRDGNPWRVAIQYPGKPEVAAGISLLTHQALAVSDSFRRRWGKWHHIVNVHTQISVEAIIGAVAVTKNAWDADSMTSALFLGAPECYAEAAQRFDAQYLVFYADGTYLKSLNWEGELF